MKVTDLNYNECIHCETEEQANAICKLMHEAGFKWCNGKPYLYYNDYNSYKSETCYIVKEGTYCDLKYAKRSNYTIYKAEQFLNQILFFFSSHHFIAFFTLLYSCEVF